MMLALLNGKATVISQYFWVALLCSQSTGGSCGYSDIYQELFTSQQACEEWILKEATRYAKHECKQVRYQVDIGHPYEGASEFYKSMIK